jgi:hypothetical protein
VRNKDHALRKGDLIKTRAARKIKDGDLPEHRSGSSSKEHRGDKEQSEAAGEGCETRQVHTIMDAKRMRPAASEKA